MTIWISGFLLGFAGSAHCVAMCGPLVVAMRGGLVDPANRASARRAAIAYQAARVATYAGLGLLAGAIGESIAIRGFGRLLAIAAGVALLAGAVAPAVSGLRPLARLAGQVAGAAMGVVRRQRPRRPLAAAAGAGAVNGLLPCGLVYAALAVALASGSSSSAATFMIAFGLGTMPAMGIIWAASGRLAPSGGRLARRIAPAAMALAGAILIARGMAPGWPSRLHETHVHAAATSTPAPVSPQN
jgi:sulfite exporter TauE/SafE